MNVQRLSLAAIGFFALVALLGFLGLDRVIAQTVNSSQPWPIWSAGTHWLEILFGFPLSKWATGFALLLVSLACFIARHRATARALAVVAVVQLATRLTVGVLKGVTPRLRPFEVLAEGLWDAQWFQEHGSSFPSGHAAHFWGLLFPIAWFYPRLALWLLPLPVFVSAARVAVNDHFLSDVAVSGAIAALLTLIAHLLASALAKNPARPSRRAA
jgi:membrane-associated phospholipid phosphatase